MSGNKGDNKVGEVRHTSTSNVIIKLTRATVTAVIARLLLSFIADVRST
jgi:hypothetical protein